MLENKLLLSNSSSAFLSSGWCNHESASIARFRKNPRGSYSFPKDISDRINPRTIKIPFRRITHMRVNLIHTLKLIYKNQSDLNDIYAPNRKSSEYQCSFIHFAFCASHSFFLSLPNRSCLDPSTDSLQLFFEIDLVQSSRFSHLLYFRKPISASLLCAFRSSRYIITERLTLIAFFFFTGSALIFWCFSQKWRPLPSERLLSNVISIILIFQRRSVLL